ncbi:MAG: hypothetical protein L0Z55_03605 [Planctomycetes bacterium]|nr:hypothetical protein [Planctomycetota bacterium]
MKTVWLALAALPLVCGCLVMGGGNRLRYVATPRLEVSFSSIAAADEFYRGIAAADRGDYTEGGGFFVIPLLVMGGATFHETEFYNAQVRRTDVDRDTVISDAEAAAYRAAMEAEKK